MLINRRGIRGIQRSRNSTLFVVPLRHIKHMFQCIILYSAPNFILFYSILLEIFLLYVTCFDMQMIMMNEMNMQHFRVTFLECYFCMGDKTIRLWIATLHGLLDSPY